MWHPMDLPRWTSAGFATTDHQGCPKVDHYVGRNLLLHRALASTGATQWLLLWLRFGGSLCTMPGTIWSLPSATHWCTSPLAPSTRWPHSAHCQRTQSGSSTKWAGNPIGQQRRSCRQSQRQGPWSNKGHWTWDHCKCSASQKSVAGPESWSVTTTEDVSTGLSGGVG